MKTRKKHLQIRYKQTKFSYFTLHLTIYNGPNPVAVL